jgi:hypothetical protein
MKLPMPPPDYGRLASQILTSGNARAVEIFTLYRSGIAHERYLPWDELRYRKPPEGLSHEEWWFAVKTARGGLQRQLSLQDVDGAPFVYALPDDILRLNDFISAYGRGRIGANEEVTNPATRDRYLVSSLIEEAITSSQLEGASTERKVAKEMIRSGREPRDKSERMIYNNYLAMQEVGRLRNEPLTPEMIRHIHRIVTDGTLEDPSAAGRFQRPDDIRVGVFDEYGTALHRPPPAELLDDRIEKLCYFANISGEDERPYLPG